jgi:GTP cyclohydrolase I
MAEGNGKTGTLSDALYRDTCKFDAPAPGDVWAGRHGWVKPEVYDQLAQDAANALPVFNYSSQHGKAKATPFAGTQPAFPGVAPTLAETLRGLLVHIDPEPGRGGLVETPDRAAKAWQDWTSGYAVDPASVLKTFEDGAQGCDEMVVVADIPVYSHCEHHLAPIFGTVTVAYLPNERIVGLSKLPRLVEVFMRRLQVQERMTNQIAEAIMEHLQPKGCGVVMKARHMCMESRGVRLAGTHTTTSALRGVFKEDHRVRSEFLAFTR